MRELNTGTKRFTRVLVLDEPGQGGACHKYQVETVVKDESDLSSPELSKVVANVSFQNGPIKEFGVNGCHQEDLFAIVIDRLECFQKGPFACRENALALTKIQEAMHWLNHRTNDRNQRGVEGTNQL